jgi:hypothetical protein
MAAHCSFTVAGGELANCSEKAAVSLLIIIIIINNNNNNFSLYCPTLGKFIMSPQEKRHGVMARIQTSDLTIERRTLYHLSYPARWL